MALSLPLKLLVRSRLSLPLVLVILALMSPSVFSVRLADTPPLLRIYALMVRLPPPPSEEPPVVLKLTSWSVLSHVLINNALMAEPLPVDVTGNGPLPLVVTLLSPAVSLTTVRS